MQETSLDEITDTDKLKAMAYDQLAALELAQGNLQAINTRLAQLAAAPPASGRNRADRRAKPKPKAAKA